MKIKKTWFSYLLWALLTGYTGVLFAVYLSGISVKIWRLNKYGTAFFIGAVFALTAGIWFLARKVWTLIGDRLLRDEHLIRIWECFLVMCLFAGVVLYRIYELLHFSGTIEGSIYYDMAASNGGAAVLEITHGASYLYACVLSLALSLMENQLSAAVLLQMILQTAALAFFYFAARRLAGRAAAFFALFLLAFLPGADRNIFVLSPELMYFLLYTIGLWLIGWYKDRRNERVKWVFAILTGAYVGVMGYLDISGWTLILFALAVGAAKKEVCRSAVCIVTAGTAMAGCMLADALITGSSFSGIWSVWTELYRAGDFTLCYLSVPDREWVAGALICFLTALGTIGFWFHREQKQEVWILLLSVFGVLEVFQIGEMRYSAMTAAVWTLLAGLGIASVKTEETGQYAVLQELEVEEIFDDAPEQKPVEEMESVTEKKPEPEKIKFIENPLPLPKKHQKKEMDFDREIGGRELAFDVDISAEDDFDII